MWARGLLKGDFVSLRVSCWSEAKPVGHHLDLINDLIWCAFSCDIDDLISLITMMIKSNGVELLLVLLNCDQIICWTNFVQGDIFAMKGFWSHYQAYPSRLVKTFFVCLIFVMLGCSAAIIGPSLMDFQISVGASFEQISYVPSARSFGYALGSIISKFQSVDRHRLSCFNEICSRYPWSEQKWVICKHQWMFLWVVLSSVITVFFHFSHHYRCEQHRFLFCGMPAVWMIPKIKSIVSLHGAKLWARLSLYSVSSHLKVTHKELPNRGLLIPLSIIACIRYFLVSFSSVSWSAVSAEA